MSWSWMGATTAGTRHLREDAPNQDAWGSRLMTGTPHGQVLMLAVADGAGSAAHAEEAATFCAQRLLRSVEAALLGGTPVDQLDPHELLQDLQAALSVHADQDDLREYACTLTAAVLGETHALLWQVGDGFLVYRQQPHGTGAGERSTGEPGTGEPGAHPPLTLAFEPTAYESVNATRFVHDAAPHELHAQLIPAPECVLLSSDGLYRLALDLSTRPPTPHLPFYPAFLGALTQPGLDGALCDDLRNYLASNAVQARTDDDVTLLAARRL